MDKQSEYKVETSFLNIFKLGLVSKTIIKY